MSKCQAILLSALFAITSFAEVDRAAGINPSTAHETTSAPRTVPTSTSVNVNKVSRGIRRETIPLEDPCYILPTHNKASYTCDWEKPYACSYTYTYRSSQKVKYLFFDELGGFVTSEPATITETFSKDFSATDYVSSSNTGLKIQGKVDALISSLKAFECKK
jgi:hypothetical protein